MQCSNNAKQIGLAMHNYHDVHKKFPKIIWGYPDLPANENGGVLPLAYHHTWLTGLLPYMEQQAVYDRIDFRAAGVGPAAHRHVVACSAVSDRWRVHQRDGDARHCVDELRGQRRLPLVADRSVRSLVSVAAQRGWVRNGDVSGLFAPGKQVAVAGQHQRRHVQHRGDC